MAAKENFFKPTYNFLGGYYIPVRDDWNYHIIKKHISEKEKEIYLQQFGEEILTEDQFYNWWKSIKHNLN
ncbi:MAG TPA: hypothetical protein DCG75_16980 [Bacteroidales bacterium]|jgi:hypothetical protein|nr:hypothetical protein [Bacteroidales bacterium]